LLMPEQTASNNANTCFNWFNPEDIARGSGEAGSIRQMIARMAGDHDIDSRRIYVTGLSAGGAMTAVMLAAYPEVFAGGAIIAGIPYKCTTTSLGILNCGVDGRNHGSVSIKHLTPAQWGKLVREATSYKGPWPHGIDLAGYGGHDGRSRRCRRAREA